MARPERHDADYFPFYAKRGRTLNILQAKFGLEGIGFFTNLLRFLTITPDHNYQIKTPLDQMNLFAEIGITDEKKGIEILDLLAMTGKIDADLWRENGVIVSESFLESLEDAYNKRNNKIITIDEIRVNYTGNPQATELPAPETHIQEDYCILKGAGNPQRKGKERKGKDIKVFIPPTLEQVTDYIIEKQLVIDPKKFIDWYSKTDWQDNNGKQIVNWKNKLVNWDSREREKNPQALPYSKPLPPKLKITRRCKHLDSNGNQCEGEIFNSYCKECGAMYDGDGNEIL